MNLPEELKALTERDFYRLCEQYGYHKEEPDHEELVHLIAIIAYYLSDDVTSTTDLINRICHKLHWCCTNPEEREAYLSREQEAQILALIEGEGFVDTLSVLRLFTYRQLCVYGL